MAIIWFIFIIFPCHCAVYMYKITILQKPLSQFPPNFTLILLLILLFKWSCSIECQAHIFFFKTKNCSNDDIFISCDDRIGKMLHNICMSAVAIVTQVSESWPVGLLFFFGIWVSWWAYQNFVQNMHFSDVKSDVNIQMLIFCVCHISPKPLVRLSWNLCQMFILSRQCAESTFQWFLHISWIAVRFFMKLVGNIPLINTICRTYLSVLSDQGHSQSSNGKPFYPLHIF